MFSIRVRASILKQVLVIGMAAALLVAGAVILIALSDDPAGFAVRYRLWRVIGHVQERTYSGRDAAEQFYVEAGHGPPLVLLHGGGGSHDAFYAQLPWLAGRFHVFGVDLRGHGRSAHGEGPLSYERYAEDVLALLDQRHLERADVVGWSDGGNAGLLLALAHPERVCRLVVIGANFDPSGLAENPEGPPPGPDDWRRGLLAWLIGLALGSSGANSPAADELDDLWSSGPNLTVADLHRIRVPVLVIGGEYDLVKRDHLIATRQAIPGAELLIVEGRGHALPYEAPVALNRALGHFLLAPDGAPRACSMAAGVAGRPGASGMSRP